jgi:transketolase
VRTAFIQTITQLAEADPRVMLLVGDLGFGVVEPFAARFPRQFVNVGIAEQNMIGVAAGLALSGRRVFAYSIGNFPTLRCLEQIRNDVCHHDADVTIVTVGGGFAYGALGASHHATEDLAIMRALPNMTVVAPGDPYETTALTRAIAQAPGPHYLRLGRAGEGLIEGGDPAVTLGNARRIRYGAQATVLATGDMLGVAVAAATRLTAAGIDCGVLSVHTLKPLDRPAILAAACQSECLVTLEEHTVIGGLGSAVAELLMDSDAGSTTLRRIGIPDTFAHEVGSQQFLRETFSLTVEHVVDAVRQAVGAAAHEGVPARVAAVT